jgi:O-antigen ligase
MILLLAIALSVFMGLKRTSPLKIKILFLSVFSLLCVALLNSNKINERLNDEMQSNLAEVLTTEKFNHVYFWTGSSIRLFQARVFWELLQEEKKYFFGYGFNSSQEQIKAKHIQYNLYPGFHNYNFHNQYLQTMAELGIIGLLSLGFILINFLKIPFKSRSLFPILTALVFLMLFLTESYLVRQRGIVYFLFYYCLIIKHTHQR